MLLGVRFVKSFKCWYEAIIRNYPVRDSFSVLRSIRRNVVEGYPYRDVLIK